MKRLILILSVILSLLGIFITAFPYILKISGLDSSFKQWLIPKVMNGNFSELEVEDFSVGLGSLNLSNLKISTRNESMTLLIKELSFGFQLHEFIMHPTDPKLAINKIVLEEPRLLLNSTLLKKTASSQNDSLEYGKFESFFTKLYGIRSINTIYIEGGRIIWQDSLRHYYAVAQNLQGTLESKKDKNFILDVRGSLFSSGGNNFRLNGDFRLLKKDVFGQLKLEAFDLSQTPQPFLPRGLNIFQGTVNADLAFANHAFDPSVTTLNGTVTVQNLHLNYNDKSVRKINFSAQVKDNSLTIDKGQGTYFENPFTFSVAAENIMRPVYRAEIDFSSLHLAAISEQLPFKVPTSAEMDMHLALNADFTAEKISGQLRSQRLSVKQATYLANSKLDFLWHKGGDSSFKFSAQSYGVLLQGKGNLVFGGKVLRLHLNAQKQNTAHLILDRMSDKNQSLALNIDYAFGQKILSGEWKYRMEEPADTLLVMSGVVGGALDRQVTITSRYCSSPDFRVTVAITNPLDDFAVKLIKIHNFPWHIFGSGSVFTKLLSRFDSDLELSGRLQSLRGAVVLHDKKKKANDLRLLTTMNNIFSSQKEIKGSLEIKNLVGFYDFSLSDRRISGKAHFPAGIDVLLDMNLAQMGTLDGTVRFSDFNLFNSFSDSAFSVNHKYQGYVNGELKLAGTYSRPEVESQLRVDRIILNDVGYYQAYAGFKSDLQKFSIDSLQLSLNNLPVLTAAGAINWQSQQISGQLVGKQVDLEHILRTISPNSNWLAGSGNYTVDIAGHLSRPVFNVRALITDGRLSRVPFDALNFIFTDSVLNGTALLSSAGHNIDIEDFTIARNGFYEFNMNGAMPLNSNDSLDLHLRFKGDALAMLPTWVPFFKKGASNTLITMDLGGNVERIKIKSALAEIDRGELWMAAVAPHVKNIHGQIRLKKGSNQVDFINLQSEVDGKILTLNTVRHVTVEKGKQLKPWYFKSLDLDFGILKMQTSKRGLSLNIPGLMAKEDFGNLYLSGKQDSDAFYFAGPVKHPVVYGQVALFDARLTYPFIVPETQSTKESVVVEFLSNLNWDLRVRSGEDVVYYRDIPAFIDNVHTELFIDESSPGLNFNGILNKGTFKVIGKLTSRRGRLDYLDQTFRVDLFSVEFNKWDIYPVVSGRAWTTLRDSVGAPPKTIYLKLYAEDKETKAEKQQGRWEDFRFKLESANPQIGESQEQVLAYMGFSVNNIKEKATSVGGAVTERYLIHPLLRPIEKALEKGLGVDLVRINSNIAKNLFYSSIGVGKTSSAYFNPFVTSNNYLFLIQSSELTIGKYLTQNVYLTYTGQLVSYYNRNQPEFDVNHSFGLEYRFLRNVLLEFEFDRELMGFYRTNQQKQYLDDFKIRLRHSFTF